MYVPRSAHESSFAPIFVCIFNLLAINPSRTSVTKLMVIKTANKFSLPERINHRINGKMNILYRDKMFGMVQNLSAVAVKAKIIFLQFNSILFEEPTSNEPANCLCHHFPWHISITGYSRSCPLQVF